MTDRLRTRATLIRFLSTEAAGGGLLVIGAVLGLVWANSSAGAAYRSLWSTDIGLLHLDARHLVNDGLMTVFFFVVASEVKREFVYGELRDRRVARLPVVAAVGGMVAPALVFLAITRETSAVRGWGIPMATDIAFALAVLSLLGSRVPSSLKALLLTLAIVDDIGAIVVIAVAYSDGLEPGWLAAAAVGVITMRYVARSGLTSAPVWWAVALLTWFATYESGAHATIAGVALALAMPARELDERVHRVSSVVILPVFALANAGLELRGDLLEGATQQRAFVGVVLGLVLGKVLGIGAAVWIAVRLRAVALPDGLGWRHVAALGGLGGIGFTVSLFVAQLAYDSQRMLEAAQLGVLTASFSAAVISVVILLVSSRADTRAQR